MVVRLREMGQVFVKSELTEPDHLRSVLRGAIVRLTGAQREKPGVVRETLEKKRLKHQGTGSILSTSRRPYKRRESLKP